MKRYITAIILSAIALAIVVPYIFAAPDYIEGTVRSLETNNPIGSLTIDIVNCTNNSQVFNSTTTPSDGTFWLDYNNTWGNYSINVSGNPSYIDRQFNNGSQCFENGTNVTLRLYPVATSSLNITLKDIANSRPIPDAIVTLYRSNLPEDPPIDQSNNYRCTAGICRTGADGTILLIVPNPGTYNITIESAYYDNWNETLATFNVFSELGKNRDYAKNLKGSGLIAGSIIDTYNGMPIQGAFVELYKHDSDPYSGENLSISGIYNYSAVTGTDGKYNIYVPPNILSLGNYDIKASHKDWTPKINYNGDPNPDGGWDSLNTNITVSLEGKLLINGSIYDCNNNDTGLSLDIYVTDKSGSGFDYHIHTDNGNFSFFVKNTSLGYNGYNITINGTEYSATILSNAQQNISECVYGSQKINGTIKDIENIQPINNAAIIISLDDGTEYNTNTIIDGTFDMDVKGETSFSIGIDKTGYTALSGLQDSDGLYETIYLTGENHIHGYIEDNEGSRRVAGPKIENVIIEIKNQTTSAQIYTTTTDADGYYSIYISSDINYTLSLNKNLYNSTEDNISAGESPNSTIYLKGTTHIEGTVLDDSPYAVNKNITSGTMLEFKNENDTVYILTASGGEYSLYMAIDSYNITASKTGYTTKTETGFISGSNIYKDINLEGELNMTLYTTDDFSSQPVDLIKIRLFDKGTGIVKYDSIITLNGKKNIYVDSNREYYIAVYENNYFPIYELIDLTELQSINANMSINEIVTINGNAIEVTAISESTVAFRIGIETKFIDEGQTDTIGTSGISITVNSIFYSDDIYSRYVLMTANDTEVNETIFKKEYRMIAKYETIITDGENGAPIENADIYAYHYFNETYYPQQLNETTVTVSVNCSGMFLDNINVTITGDSYYDSGNTTAGVITFSTVPLNNYTVEANGSLNGCSTRNVTVNVTRGGIAYNTTIELNTTMIMVHVTNKISETIYPANVSYENLTGYNITMQGFNNTYYYDSYVVIGSYNISANESDHYSNTVDCNVTVIGEVNWCNITLLPRPGNLSIYIYNSTGDPITNATVNITNGTDSYELNTTDGWANFTDIESVWNVTINASDMGYQNEMNNNIYVYPDDETIYNQMLLETFILIWVSDDLGIIENATVSLTDPNTGAMMQNHVGEYMTDLTDQFGYVIFERFNQSSYNITINETSHEFYNQTYELSVESDNWIFIDLDTTRMTVNVDDTYGAPLENIYVILKKTDGTMNFTGYTNISGQIIFENQTFPPGIYNLTVNGSSEGYNYTVKQINIYAGSQNIENVVLEEFRLTVQVNSSYDSTPAYNVTIDIGTLPEKTTDLNGIAEFRNLENRTYSIMINGSEVGYNNTAISVNVTGDTKIYIFLKENTFKIIVEDEEGNPVDGGVEITLWDPYDTNIYDDAFGNNLINHTTASDNNITFRKMQYEPSPGNTVTMTTDGSGQGYSINQTDYTILNGTNGPNTTILSITQMLVNVTNATGGPINAAYVKINTTSGDPVQNALGQTMYGMTASNGTITFKRLLPNTYNVSIEKNVSGTMVYNSTLITIDAGEHEYVHLDPNDTIVPSLKGTYYTDIFDSETYDLTINASGLAGPVDNVTVKIYAAGYNYSDSYWYNYEATDNKTTDANGIIVISNMPSGVYDVLIDGEAQGYGITKTQIRFGKLVFSKGTTGSDGIVEIPVDGRKIEDAVDNGYFIRVTGAGYRTYDALNNGESGIEGTYYDHAQYDQDIYPGYEINNRTEISLTGIINMTGTIIDKFALNAQPGFRYLKSVFLEFILHGTQTVRYTTYTDINGTYQINVSPVVASAIDLSSPLTYDIRSSKTGYTTDMVEEAMPADPASIISDIGLEGSGTVDGTVLTYDDNGPVSGIIVRYIDNATVSEIYKTTTDNDGKYSMKVNPYYQPYKLSFSDPTSNTKNHTTQSYTEPHTDEIYYLLEQDQAIINIYVLDDYSAEVENAKVTIDSIIDGNTTTFYTNENGKVDFFIDGEGWNLGQYNITADGKTLGYGSGYKTQNINLIGYNPVTITINTTKINISATGNLGNSIYNTTANLTGTMSDSKEIENNTAIFSKIVSGNYTVTLTSPYFSYYTTPIEINDSNAGTAIQKNIILNESMISIRVINQTGGTLENISISVNGPTPYSEKTDSSGWLNRTQVLSGNYTISFTNATEFTGSNYFIPQNISVTQTIGNTTYIEVTAIERIINVTVHAYDIKDIYNTSRAEISGNTLNISLTNDTGITLNKTGDANSIIAGNGIANFTTLYEGVYRINASGSNYTSENETMFNTTEPEFSNTPQDIFLKKTDMAYINETVLSGGSAIGGAQVKLYWNSTTLLESIATDSYGRVIIPINATVYNSTLHMEISKTGYVTKTTAQFSISIGDIYDNTTSITLETSTPPPPGGSSSDSSSPPSTFLPPPTAPEPEDNDTVEDTDIIQKIYEYTEALEEIESKIKDNAGLNNMLSAYFGDLSNEDIYTISRETETGIKDFEISRDIYTDEEGNTVIGINAYYTGDSTIESLAIYDTLPQELVEISEIVITESSAEIFTDIDRNSYLSINSDIEPDTYHRVEFKTDKKIEASDIDSFTKPVIVLTGMAKKEAVTEPDRTDIIDAPEPKKSILNYWWIFALAAAAVIAGVIVARTAGKKSSGNYSFSPNETRKPLNPPTTPDAGTPYGFGISQNRIAALPEKVASTVEKIEEEISEDIKKVAQKEVAYLTKPLEKGKFIVD